MARVEQGMGLAVEHPIALLDGGQPDGLCQMALAAAGGANKESSPRTRETRDCSRAVASMSFAAHRVQRLKQECSQEFSGTIEGRPILAYKLLKRAFNCCSASSVMARNGRNG